MLCSAPLGHVASLSTQKFSSNVMEACLERALPEVQVCWGVNSKSKISS